MVFVPMTAHRATPPSARALDLARRLQAEIEKFNREYPGTSEEDLRTAANIAIGAGGTPAPAQRRVIAAAISMAGVLVLLGAMFMANRDAGTATPFLKEAGVLLAVFAAVLGIALRRRK